MIKRKSPLGININSQNIIVASLEGRKGADKQRLVLSKLSLPAGCYSDGLVLNRQGIVERLASYVKEAGLQNRPATVAVNPRQAVIRPVRMPVMPEKELRKALEFEIGRYSSLSNTPFTMDFIRQGRVEADGVQQEDLLAVAVKDSVLNELCALVQEAGLKIKAVDLEPSAFVYLRAFAAAQDIWPQMEEDWAAVELGAGKTMVAFFRREMLQFVHTIPIGFADDPYVLGDILRELQRSLDYYHLNLKKPQTKEIYIWGTEAVKALPQFQAALPYQFVHRPLAEMAPALQTDADSLSDEAVLAVGMALREVVK